MQGLLGKKIGMTRVFNAQGQQVPVTAIACGPCTVLQRKTSAQEGYDAVQLSFGATSAKGLTRAALGVFNKLNLPPLRHRCELPLETGDELKPGDVLTVKLFEGVPFVDVSGVSKGKGFAGVVRRFHMRGGPMTHGGHSKRRVGSVGCRELPGRIHKGKRMPGHMGAERVTQQNLEVVKIYPDEHVLLVRGAVPGHAGAVVLVKKSLKRGQNK
ncbi:MAG: 50S ribosomal protein L3 [Lentisphaerae bacterium]|nr:50S ribosomal protein L3 [Lentisphaerota bacterium]